MSTMTIPARAALMLVLAVNSGAAMGELPPVPVPPENPITEPKRVLGKILFWDEQLSSDDTVACGTCHRPAAGGADPRAGLHPGSLPGSFDDVRGSPGIRLMDRDGDPVEHPIFGLAPQVTQRTAPSIFGALWADEVFWDGRAGGQFVDPLSGQTIIAAGGALETQALATLANSAEMAKTDRAWHELTDKLAGTSPLALADRWPADVASAIAERPSYPELFAAAFGDPAITPARIAMAIASYERTLIPDQTPWDRYVAGDDDALSQVEQFGWQAFDALRCTSCHVPPLFTSNDFANIGLRRSRYDAGREAVTGDPEDAGEMRIPSLRNVGLRERLMHTGEFSDVGGAVAFYRNTTILPDVDTLPGGGAYAFTISALQAADIVEFLTRALTDPRVAAEAPPFDRPRLRSERNEP
ncbi:MAG: cytochrome c peroxidase [Gammaproteobacteria bacterium]|nr:cytochrome c peroxidase [Gammaproteobacteria bacterium]